MTERDFELNSIQEQVMDRIRQQQQEDNEKNDDGAFESVGEFMCPLDPMERLQCESCQ